MNRLHHWICSSNGWRERLAHDMVPYVLDGADLGRNVLEIGPVFAKPCAGG